MTALDDVRAAADRLAAAETARDAALAVRRGAVAAALAERHPVTAVAEAARVSRVRLYAIRDGK